MPYAAPNAFGKVRRQKNSLVKYSREQLIEGLRLIEKEGLRI